MVISGNVMGLIGGFVKPPFKSGSVRLTLVDYGHEIPRNVTGVTFLPLFVDADVESDGGFTLSVPANDEIWPGGTTWALSFNVPLLSHGKPPVRYRFLRQHGPVVHRFGTFFKEAT